MKKIVFFLLALGSFGCTKTSLEDFEILEEKLASGGNPLYGRWERQVGSNGDYTEIAVGNITGEPSNRVYMCEKNGSAAGLYKGYLNGSTITWDAEFGVPDFVVSIQGERFVVNVPSCSFCLPTYYDEDPWEGLCGPI